LLIFRPSFVEISGIISSYDTMYSDFCHMTQCTLISVIWHNVLWFLSYDTMYSDSCHMTQCTLISVIWSNVFWFLSCDPMYRFFFKTVIFIICRKEINNSHQSHKS
jgi:hypothetical protein